MWNKMTTKNILKSIEKMQSNLMSIESSLLISTVAGFIAVSDLTYALIKYNVNLMFLAAVVLIPAIVILYRAHSAFRTIISKLEMNKQNIIQ